MYLQIGMDYNRETNEMLVWDSGKILKRDAKGRKKQELLT
jgi:hypothetical protein